jgi:hypothetical protein
MNNSNISIQDRTRNFANRVIFAYVELNKKTTMMLEKFCQNNFLDLASKTRFPLMLEELNVIIKTLISTTKSLKV